MKEIISVLGCGDFEISTDDVFQWEGHEAVLTNGLFLVYEEDGTGWTCYGTEEKYYNEFYR